ncbi:MAG: tetratricopeptide repeat protein [Armatimonadota bacterium]|jgi:tetratricopeptide (TPR) repeat protein
MRRHAPVLILVVVIAGGVFANALGGDFVWDDNYIIGKNAEIREWRRALTCFGLNYWLRLRADSVGMKYRSYRPVPELTFALDYSIWKLNPFGFHITSVLVHVANSVLVYLLAYGIFGTRRGAAFCAVLFAAHPIHVEAVVWAKARSAPLALLFMLAALLLYRRYAGRSSGAAAAALHGGSLAAFGLALGCKESAIVLPVLLAVYLWCFVPRRRLPRLLLGLLPFVGMAAVFFAVRAGLPPSPYPVLTAPLGHRLLTAFATVGQYLRLLVVPVGLCLNHDFGIVRWPHHPFILQALPWELPLAASIIVAYRRSKTALFALLWTLISLAPVSNLILLGRPIAEPRAYVPSVGFCLLASLLLLRLPALQPVPSARSALRKLSFALCGLLVVLYAGLTIARNTDWADHFRLFEDTIAKNPRSVTAYHSLALTYLYQDRTEPALESFKRAIAILPTYPDSLEGLATIYFDTERYEQSIPYYKRLLAMWPTNVRLHQRLGLAYAATGDLGRAMTEFQRTLELDPEHAPAQYNLGLAYVKLGDYARATPALERAVHLAPDDEKARYGLALCYEREGESDRALPEYEEALRLLPDSSPICLATAECHEKLGNRAEAIRLYRKCLELGDDEAALAQRRLAHLGALPAPRP